MIIPVLSTHKSGNSKTQKTDYRCRRSLSLTFQQLVSQREEAGHANPFANVKEMPLEERQKILDGFNAHMNSPEGKKQFEVQCPMGAPESNMNWQDIKDALDEQDFEAFWVVEREGFYDEHDKCIADDARWIKENIH